MDIKSFSFAQGAIAMAAFAFLIYYIPTLFASLEKSIQKASFFGIIRGLFKPKKNIFIFIFSVGLFVCLITSAEIILKNAGDLFGWWEARKFKYIEVSYLITYSFLIHLTTIYTYKALKKN